MRACNACRRASVSAGESASPQIEVHEQHGNNQHGEHPVPFERSEFRAEQRAPERVERGHQNEFQRHDECNPGHVRRTPEQVVQHHQNDQAQHDGRLYER